MTNFKYRSFISYSHSDQKWGRWLHKALETYRIPKELVGVETAIGTTPKRLGRVFRDDDELGTASDLGERITAALQNTDTLIVICSPRSAKSQWVNKEIIEFKALGRGSRVFAVIVDGEPYSDNPETECFPEALKYQVSSDGKVLDLPAEPLATDLRKFGREDALLRLISGILHVDYDALKKREAIRARERARRNAMLAFGGFSLAGVAAFAAVLAMFQWKSAESERSLASARFALERLAQGDGVEGAVTAIQSWPATPLKEWAIDNRAVQFEALYRAAATKNEAFRLSENQRPVYLQRFSADSRYLLTNAMDGAIVWDLQEGRFVPRGGTDAIWASFGAMSDADISAGGEFIVVKRGNMIGPLRVIDGRENKVIAQVSMNGSIVRFDRTNPHTLYSAARQGEREIVKYEIDGGNLTKLAETSLVRSTDTWSSTYQPSDLKLSDDGRWLLGYSEWNTVVNVWDTKDLSRTCLLNFREEVENNSLKSSAPGDSINFIAFDDKGENIIISQNEWESETERFIPYVSIWNINACSTTKAFEFPVMDGWVDVISKNAKYAVMELDGGVIELWDLEAEKSLWHNHLGHNTDYDDAMISFFGQGDYLFTAIGGHIRIWSSKSGRLLRQLDDEDLAVRSLKVSPDEHFVSVGFTDGSIRIWSVEDFADEQPDFTIDGEVGEAEISPDGRYSVIGTASGMITSDGARLGAAVQVLDNEALEASLATIRFVCDISQIRMFGNSREVFIGTTCGEMVIIDLERGKVKSVLRSVQEREEANGLTTERDPVTGEEYQVFTTLNPAKDEDYDRGVVQANIADDQKTIMVMLANGMLQRFAKTNVGWVLETEGIIDPSLPGIRDADFSADNATLMLMAHDGVYRLTMDQLGSDEPIATSVVLSEANFEQALIDDQCEFARFDHQQYTSDGRYIVVQYKMLHAMIIDVETGAIARHISIPGTVDNINCNEITHLSFHADDQGNELLFILSEDNKLRVWNIAEEQPIQEMGIKRSDASRSPTEFTLTKDGAFAAAGFDEVVYIFHVETGAIVGTHFAPNGEVQRLRFSEDGSLLLAAWEDNIRLLPVLPPDVVDLKEIIRKRMPVGARGE